MQHIRINFHSIISIILCSVIIICSCNFAYATPVSDTATHNILSNIYDRMQYILNVLYSTNSSLYGGAGDTYQSLNLHQVVQQCAILIQAVGAQTADVSSKLITTNNTLSNIANYTDGLEGSLSTINSNLVTYTEHVQGYLHDVSWKTLNPTFEFSNDGITYSSLDDFTVRSGGKELYIKIYYSLQSSQYLSYLRIPFNTLGNINVSYLISYNSSVGTIDNFDYSVFYSFRNTDLYILPFNVFGSSTYPTVLKLTFTRPFYKSTNGNPELFYKYLTPDMQDYYSVESLIYNYNQNKILNDFKYLYASDDLVAAKQGQQNYEDQVIDDFTGSGSAAASGSDATSLKNISGSLKSGLDSGGSISGALGVFNDSSDLWKWFSQDNYNDINGQPTRSDDGIIDFYNINQEKLQELLQNEYR